MEGRDSRLLAAQLSILGLPWKSVNAGKADSGAGAQMLGVGGLLKAVSFDHSLAWSLEYLVEKSSLCSTPSRMPIGAQLEKALDVEAFASPLSV